MSDVLLLDDDKDLRSLIRTAMTAHGLSVLEAGSIAQATQVLSTTTPPPDVIVVDGLLPDGLGIDFIAQHRAQDKRARIVFLSAYFKDMQTFRRLTDELGVSVVLHKPVDPMSLAHRVVSLRDELHKLDPPRAALNESMDELIAREFNALREEFTRQLPDKIAEVESVLRSARKHVEHLQSVRTLAHRLRGSAGSYGHPLVGDAMGALEDAVVATNDAKSFPHLFWERAAATVQEARRALRSSAETGYMIGEPINYGGKPLLVVDDDSDFLNLVRSMGKRLYVEVLVAHSKEEALLHAHSRELLAAVLDVHVHDEQTFELARRIRETEKNADLPIAFASLDRSIETRIAAIEAGGTKFLEKPHSDDSLAELIQQFIQLSQSQQRRVLIVEDDVDVMEQYTRHLRAAGYRVDQLFGADSLVEQMELAPPDVLLLDVNLPFISGVDICRALRMSDRWELLPILMITSRSDAGVRIAAFRAGASDVVIKPMVAEELLARVGVQVAHLRLMRERAEKDTLSGLLLRRAFLDALDRSMAAAARDGKPVALVMIDIDRFKQVNDKHGHLAGDQVIARLGSLLRRKFRVEDLRGRWGGEEFLLAFPGQTAEFAALAAQRLLKEFSELIFTSDDGENFNVTFTAGVAVFPEDGESSAALIRHADRRLYRGKHEGRARVSGRFTSVALSKESK